MLTSLRNPRVRDIVQLRNRRHREREGRFVVEGRRELTAAANAGFPVQTVYHCEDFHGDHDERHLLKRLAAAGATCEATNRQVFERISYRRTPDGLLGVATTPALTLAEIRERGAKKTNGSLWLVAAGIENPGNLGAMLRSADAAGVHGALLADPLVDVFNPNTVRASLGALFSVPIAVASANAVQDWLHEQRIRTYVASPNAGDVYTNADLRGDVALVVGSESAGLSDDWLTSHPALHIPMFGQVDSINASATAALLLFEARRQRGPGCEMSR